MDQTEAQAVTSGENKVIFQRSSYYGTANHDGFQTGVRIGPASYMTYTSPDYSGSYGTKGYGSIAFDPTHAGAGRMYLAIGLILVAG